MTQPRADVYLGKLLLAATTVASLVACDKGPLPGPKPDVKAQKGKPLAKVELPAVPDEAAFAFPKHDDGAHSVKELRVKGDQYFDQHLTARGFIVKTYTWAVDCAAGIEKKPGWTEVEVMKAIEADPTQCALIKFYLGDTKDTPVAQALWVVDVPRNTTPQEKANLPKEELLNVREWKEVIPFDVGDEVVVTGTFARSSPNSERNLKGLLVYETMKNITKGLESKPLPPETEPPPARKPGGG